MKAKRYTTAMLIALIFATASIQAQSARRPVTQDKNERAKTSSTYKRETSSTRAKSTQPARKAQTKQVRSQQTHKKQPARTSARSNNGQQVRKQNVSTNNGREYVRNQNANNREQLNRNQNGNKLHAQQVVKQDNRNKQGQPYRKPVSMTTSKNPRSTYRKPNNKFTTEARYHAPVKKKNHYNHRAYYGGHHYHYAYPTRNVKIHYHHNTYANNYCVLYYPTYGDIYWTRSMYRNYHNWYPGFHWNYSYGHRIHSISVFDAKYNLGEVAYVYGRVYASWYNNETDDYLLFFGGDYPYQQFTAVVPGHIARKYSWRPEKYFLGEHVTINGLITTFDGSPEIVVKHRSQLSLY